MIDTSAPNGSRNFIIPVYYGFVHETSSVCLTVAKDCVAYIYYNTKSQDADLWKHRAPDLLLSAAQNFVPDAELPTRDLDNGITICKWHAIRICKRL
jgi:hypothetical protein